MSPNNVSGPNSANKKKHESPNNAASAYAHTHTHTQTHTHKHVHIHLHHNCACLWDDKNV